MDRRALLATFDDQMRRQAGGGPAEREPQVTRVIGADDGWSGVVWSDLDEGTADAVIAAEVRRFAGRRWEWKHHSHDRPPDLPERLLAAGFVRQPPETLLVAAIADLALESALPPGVEIRPVVDEAGAAALVRVHDEVFGDEHAAVGRALLAALARPPAAVTGVVAFAGDLPVASARVEVHAGTAFATLWGGGTLPAWRGRGLFRALVAHRAALAAARGFRYLAVDARDASRPILERLGFVPLTTTTPFIHA